MKILLIGTDPEVFLERQGKVINAIPYVGMGTKDEPMPMDKPGFSFMYDRASVEWNQPPTLDLNEFKANLAYAMGYIQSVVPNDVKFSEVASVFLDQDEIDKDPRCIESGCHSSFCCYGMEELPPPNIKKFPTLQACAFHIHIQFDELTIPKAEQVVRALDVFLGAPSVILDTDMHRRSIYGSAGNARFHFKQNRLEYRVLSNFVLFNEKLIDWVWNNIFRAIDYLNEHETINEYEEMVREIIDNSNLSLAHELNNKLNLIPEGLLQKV